MTARIINLAKFKADRAKQPDDPFALWAKAWAEFFSIFWGVR